LIEAVWYLTIMNKSAEFINSILLSYKIFSTAISDENQINLLNLYIVVIT